MFDVLLSEYDALQYLADRGATLTVYSLRTWRNLRRPDQPKYIKVGRRVYYKPQDLETWLSTPRARQFMTYAA